MLRMAWLALREARGGRAKLIHARSYMPAAVALLVHKVTGVPFIFDMRALWPEELITAGRLARGSLLHRAIVAVERSCLHDAAAVVSLTHAAVAHLQREYPGELEGQTIEVIPTCADLGRFTPAVEIRRRPTVHGCIGTILSGWFRADLLATWLSIVAQHDPDAQFDIVTRDDANRVRAALDSKNLLGNRLAIDSRSPADMPDALRRHDLSVMFFTDGLSKLGSAPTRMAEVLGCGLPVVANEGVGDVAEVVRQNRVGVIVEGPEPMQMQTALENLQELMQDSDLATRCRATAEALYSLEAGTAAYRGIYASIVKSKEEASVA